MHLLRKQLLLVAMSIILPLSLPAQTKVAILPVADKEGNVSYGIRLMLTSSLTTAISDAKGYEAFDRIDLSSVLDEQHFQRTGLVSDTEIHKLGEMTGASFVLIAEAATISATHLFASAKIVDVESAKIFSSAGSTIPTEPDAMLASCQELANKLLKQKGASSINNQTSRQVTTPAPSNEINGHEWVDLGLSVKWATCNVGASKPEDYGNYYAWGETTAKSQYNESTYKWYNGSSSNITKYNFAGEHGKVDNKRALELSDDAARANWGGSWRMPTDAEWKELRTKCAWIWTTKNGVNGYSVYGINGNSIFLPAAGTRDDTSFIAVGSIGDYWSSSTYTGSPDLMRTVFFKSGGVYESMGNRYRGKSVRPITE